MLNNFVLYRLPNESKINFIDDNQAKSISTINEIENKAFVISPFDYNSKHSMITYNIDLSRNINENELLNLSIHPTYQNTIPISGTKETHINNVNKMISMIKSQEINKGVLSRVKRIKRQKESINEIFLKLCKSYPSAFVYLASLPNGEIWCGASPETLAIYKNGIFNTVALAGTQTVDDRKTDNIVWKSKEIQEQKWVQDHISTIFKDAEIPYKKTDSYTSPAGHLVHLRNDFKAEVNAEQSVELIKKLHPTPAVCGTPTLAAKKVILDLEEHQREYYSGFLGILNPESTQLFVNLRCMKIDSDNYHLFVGGGITAESDAESEWLETENKAQTLERVLKN